METRKLRSKNMESSGYNPIIQTSTGDTTSGNFFQETSSVNTSMVEIIKNKSLIVLSDQVLLITPFFQ